MFVLGFLVVLNLIITGIPSILLLLHSCEWMWAAFGFKPYYNWNTFNTKILQSTLDMGCPNSFKPYYNWNTFNTFYPFRFYLFALPVLNLIITGIPSIRLELACKKHEAEVLNLIITGIPSIQNWFGWWNYVFHRFKPYYNWNTFNTCKWYI